MTDNEVIERLGLPPLAQIEAYLRATGWCTWYNPRYWVNDKTVARPYVQDYTNYGLAAPAAYLFETEGWDRAEPGVFGLPGRFEPPPNSRIHTLEKLR